MLRNYFLLIVSILLGSCSVVQKRPHWEPNLYMFERTVQSEDLAKMPRLRRCQYRSKQTNKCLEWTHLEAVQYQRGVFVPFSDISDLEHILNSCSLQGMASSIIGGQ